MAPESASYDTLSDGLIDQLAEAVTFPPDPHTRSVVIATLTAEIFETLRWLHGSDPDREELTSLYRVLAECSPVADGRPRRSPSPWMTTSTSWRDQGACLQENPELFFPIGTTGPADRQVAQAKQVCAHCLVRSACLEFAITTAVDHGVWGGLSEVERRALKRRAARARVR